MGDSMKWKGTLLELPCVKVSEVKGINLSRRNRTSPFSPQLFFTLKLELLTHPQAERFYSERAQYGNLAESVFLFKCPSGWPRWGRKVGAWAQKNPFNLSPHSLKFSVFRSLHPSYLCTCLIPSTLSLFGLKGKKRDLGRFFQVRQNNTRFWRNRKQTWSFIALGLVKCPLPRSQLQLHNQKTAPRLLKARLCPLTSQ